MIYLVLALKKMTYWLLRTLKVILPHSSPKFCLLLFTNSSYWVWGLYSMLCTLFFWLQFSVKHEGHELKWKKQGAITYSVDWIYLTPSLSHLEVGCPGTWGTGPQTQTVRTPKSLPYLQPSLEARPPEKACPSFRPSTCHPELEELWKPIE